MISFLILLFPFLFQFESLIQNLTLKMQGSFQKLFKFEFKFLFEKKEKKKRKKIPISVFNNVVWPETLIDFWFSFLTWLLFWPIRVITQKKKKRKENLLLIWIYPIAPWMKSGDLFFPNCLFILKKNWRE